jgi:hypothetical protein
VTRRLVRPSAALFVPNKRKKVSVEYLKTWFFFDFIMVVLRFHYHSRGVWVAWDGGDFSYWCAPRRRGAASRSAGGPLSLPAAHAAERFRRCGGTLLARHRPARRTTPAVSASIHPAVSDATHPDVSTATHAGCNLCWHLRLMLARQVCLVH